MIQGFCRLRETTFNASHFAPDVSKDRSFAEPTVLIIYDDPTSGCHPQQAGHPD